MLARSVQSRACEKGPPGRRGEQQFMICCTSFALCGRQQLQEHAPTACMYGGSESAPDMGLPAHAQCCGGPAKRASSGSSGGGAAQHACCVQVHPLLNGMPVGLAVRRRDQPPGFPFEGYDLEELILPDGDDMDIRSDDEASEEEEMETVSGFGSVIGASPPPMQLPACGPVHMAAAW